MELRKSEGAYPCPIPWHIQAIWRREVDSVRNVRPDLVDAWLTGDSWPNEFSGEGWDSRGFEAPRGLDPLACASVLGATDCVDPLLAAGAAVESVSDGADMGWCTPWIQAPSKTKKRRSRRQDQGISMDTPHLVMGIVAIARDVLLVGGEGT